MQEVRKEEVTVLKELCFSSYFLLILPDTTQSF